jgi:hypothetical protein
MIKLSSRFIFYTIIKNRNGGIGNENKIAAGDCFINVVCVCGYLYKTISNAAKITTNKQ